MYRELYNKILCNLSDIIEKSLSEQYQEYIISVHTYASDLETWMECLAKRYEAPTYVSALEELNCAVLFLLNGQYRQSFSSLRYCLEQTMFGVFLSTNELYYRLWTLSKKDLYWSEITNENYGIFSADFISAFSNEFSDDAKELRGIACTLYRELSEYIHGNPKANGALPAKCYTFSKDCFFDIFSKIQTLSYLINIVFFIRYRDYIIQEKVFEKLENIIIDNIGTHTQVQAFFSQLHYEYEEKS